MESIVIVPDLASLDLFALGLAQGLRGGDVLSLSGPIGAGKTTLTRSLVRALTGEDTASSPSFMIWQRYEGPCPINHLDLYRIEDPAELLELGLHEAFDATSCTIVEWPERAPQLFDQRCLQLFISGSGDDARTLRIVRPQ